MDREAWWAVIHGVAKSWTQLNAHTHTHTHTQVVIIEALQPRVSARNIWELGWGHESPPQ